MNLHDITIEQESDGSIVIGGQVCIDVDRCGADHWARDLRRAMAARIIATFNACNGLLNSELSHGRVVPLHRYSTVVNQRDELRNALHQISLASQNSMSSKEECGRIAREALAQVAL